MGVNQSSYIKKGIDVENHILRLATFILFCFKMFAAERLREFFPSSPPFAKLALNV